MLHMLSTCELLHFGMWRQLSVVEPHIGKGDGLILRCSHGAVHVAVIAVWDAQVTLLCWLGAGLVLRLQGGVLFR